MSNACGGLQAGCCALEVVEFQRRLSAATTFRTCLVSGAGGGRGAVAVGEGGGGGGHRLGRLDRHQEELTSSPLSRFLSDERFT